MFPLVSHASSMSAEAIGQCASSSIASCSDARRRSKRSCWLTARVAPPLTGQSVHRSTTLRLVRPSHRDGERASIAPGSTRRRAPRAAAGRTGHGLALAVPVLEGAHERRAGRSWFPPCPPGILGGAGPIAAGTDWLGKTGQSGNGSVPAKCPFACISVPAATLPASACPCRTVGENPHDCVDAHCGHVIPLDKACGAGRHHGHREFATMPDPVGTLGPAHCAPGSPAATPTRCAAA